ncbi:hypothetical protein J3R30DRAFT_3660026 [Lentinula aciculospora]|uniref:KOW domain-containing protein n=1 Tax=Lentinula aciculospora TaxID=153920 RepID=A0A9W9DJC3_9AGAR|nr:hypothetical protein J3R30DRAFT_3660026 [Lentinula aciculospora]
MPFHRLTRHEIVFAVSRSPWTTSFRHLLPVSKILNQKLNRTSFEAFSKKVVAVKDRIKYWNIVPGDQIRLLGGRRKGKDSAEGKNVVLHEVVAVNKFRNRVYVRGMRHDVSVSFGYDKPSPEAGQRQDKNYHYSRCQLFLGEHELPLKAGQSQRQVVPVFAQRLGTSPPVWNSYSHNWQWERFATKTVPVLPERRGERIVIPWPKSQPIIHADATPYDTLEEQVLKVTYKPPPFSPTLRGLLPRVPTETEYLRALYNSFAGTQPPVEQFLFKELSNPHSRAKKMKRWQEVHRAKRMLLNEYIDEELKDLKGRTKGEARAEAAFRWRQKLEEDKKEGRKIQWMKKGGEEKLERKIKMRKRKEEKQRLRLASLTLKEEPNQVIPQEL